MIIARLCLLVLLPLLTIFSKESIATGINNLGEVVGASSIWDKGTMTDLNAAIAPSNGMILDQATGINNSGQIVGVGIIKNNDKHAFSIAPNFS